MNKRECCRTVFSALEGAHDKNGVALKISDLTKKRIEIACGIISKMSEEDGLELVQVVALPEKLVVTLECDDELLFENGKTHPFFSLINKFDKFSFSKAEDDRLRIILIMDKLWVN